MNNNTPKKYKSDYLNELKENFSHIRAFTPEEEEREREKAAAAWVRVARVRGHGLSPLEEGMLNI